MVNEYRVTNSKSLAGFAIAIFAVAISLNDAWLQYEPLDLWIRILCPLLLISGITGSLYRFRFLRLIGWLGILLYIPCAIGMILPGEDYIAGGPNGPPLVAPKLPSIQETAIRFILFLILILVLVITYKKIGSLHNVPGKRK